MKKLILSSFALVAFVFASSSAFAQPGPLTAESALAVTLPTVMSISAVNSTSMTSTFLPEELTEGKFLTNAVELNTLSNKKTYVMIQATKFLGPNSLEMPASIVQFKTDAVGDEFATEKVLTGTAQLLSGAVGAGLGNGRGPNTILVSYKLTPGLDYEPASYTSTITYTITGN